MLFKKNILIIFNSDLCEHEQEYAPTLTLKHNFNYNHNHEHEQTAIGLELDEIIQEEQIRGGISEVAYKIGNILKNTSKSKVIYLEISSAHQLKVYLDYNKKFDLIVNLCEPIFSDFEHESAVAAILEESNIPYTGNPAHVLKLTANKNHFNTLLKKNGFPAVESYLFSKPADLEKWLKQNHSIDEYPFIVKLNSEDASLGISGSSVVYNEKTLTAKVLSNLKKYDQDVLVQRYIDGREIHVAYYGHNPVSILGISELDFSELPKNHPRIYTYSAKWDSSSDDYKKIYICESKMEDDVQYKMKDLAIKIIKFFDFKGYGRMDFRLSTDGIPYLIDANPNCNISDNSCFAVLAERINFNYENIIIDLCQKVIDAKIKTQQQKQQQQSKANVTNVTNVAQLLFPNASNTAIATN
ncbi:MAG: hypothetical protein HQK49_14395 [Oligoflexia bacterium]|nr:hypothetical protein [Oligoflexia bacterium]